MKAVIYTRVSTERQSEEGFSLEAQLEKLTEHIKYKEWTLTKIYTDPGLSAKDLNRPGVQQMISDLKENKFEALLVHKLDRLTRDVGDLDDLVDLCVDKGVKLVSYSEDLDITTASGRMFVNILGMLAQYYRDNLREEVLKGMSYRAKQGLRNSFVKIMGYDIDGQTLTVNDEEAQWVKWMFNKYNDGWSATRITKELNILKVPTQRGGVWHWDTVASMLKNYTYLGMNHWKPKNLPESKRTIEEGNHEAIIEQDLFDSVQERMKNISVGSMNRSSFDYIFSTILKCSCGATFHARGSKYRGKNKLDSTYRNYRCSGKDRLGNCDSPDIAEWKVEDLFLKELDLKIEGMGSSEKVTVKEDTTDKERKYLLKELSKSERTRDNWAYAFGEGKMPLEQYSRLMDAEMEKVEQLNGKINALPVFRESVLTESDIVDFCKNTLIMWDQLTHARKKELVNIHFEKIIIQKDEEWKVVDMVIRD